MKEPNKKVEKETVTAGAVFLFTLMVVFATAWITWSIAHPQTYEFHFKCGDVDATLTVVAEDMNISCDNK